VASAALQKNSSIGCTTREGLTGTTDDETDASRVSRRLLDNLTAWKSPALAHHIGCINGYFDLNVRHSVRKRKVNSFSHTASAVDAQRQSQQKGYRRTNGVSFSSNEIEGPSSMLEGIDPEGTKPTIWTLTESMVAGTTRSDEHVLGEAMVQHENKANKHTIVSGLMREQWFWFAKIEITIRFLESCRKIRSVVLADSLCGI
jgi:hypothetical protein